MSRVRLASAWRTAASDGRGSMVKRRWSFLTKSPSLKWTPVRVPPTRDRTATVAMVLTDPIARAWTGTVLVVALATSTGAGGGSGRAAGGRAQPASDASAAA